MTQLDLLKPIPHPTQPDRILRFDGATIDEKRDAVRLTGLALRVRKCMSDGEWYTLRDLVERCGGSEGGVSARLRDFRKDRYGNQNVEKRNTGGGVWEYRMPDGWV